jgi:hypothetical protein
MTRRVQEYLLLSQRIPYRIRDSEGDGDSRGENSLYVPVER